MLLRNEWYFVLLCGEMDWGGGLPNFSSPVTANYKTGKKLMTHPTNYFLNLSICILKFVW